MFNSTCASRDYPKGDILKVTYKNKTIECRINDYGPEAWTGRDIDLSSYAFKQLAPLKQGLLKENISYATSKTKN